jgi:hypothetical protein
LTCALSRESGAALSESGVLRRRHRGNANSAPRASASATDVRRTKKVEEKDIEGSRKGIVVSVARNAREGRLRGAASRRRSFPGSASFEPAAASFQRGVQDHP